MKKFTCKEMGGVCDEVFEGETFKEVGESGGQHIMGTSDDAHKSLREQMANLTEENAQKWWDWFSEEWDKKEYA